jgi:uncharacterized protein (DUF433 family)
VETASRSLFDSLNGIASSFLSGAGKIPTIIAVPHPRQKFDSAKSTATVPPTIMTTSPFPHIVLDAPGVAWVDETNTKVREIALDVIAHGWSPKEIHLHHPHLSLAQIHAALAYYYDHKRELDAEIEAALRKAEALRAEAGESPLRQRLIALRRAP